MCRLRQGCLCRRGLLAEQAGSAGPLAVCAVGAGLPVRFRGPQEPADPNKGEGRLLPSHLRKGHVGEEARLVAGQGRRLTKGM